jgi:hypothetical protein
MSEGLLLPFLWNGSTSLRSELTKPLQRLSLIEGFDERFMAITLWRLDGTSLTISSQMHDIADKVEVGQLCFELASDPEENQITVDLPPSFQNSIHPFKLTGHECGSEYESGLTLRTDADENLTILTADFPFKLVILGSTKIAPKGVPEYSLEYYVEAPGV